MGSGLWLKDNLSLKRFCRINVFFVQKTDGAVYILNGILTMVILVLSALAVYLFFFAAQETQKMPPGAPLTINKTTDQGIVFSTPKPFGYYAERFNKKNIFQVPIPSPPPNSQSSQAENQGVGDQPLIKNLNLVGIVIDQKPIAIIEDLQTQETLFLSAGDHIREAVIEEIKKNTVVLKYKGEHIELTQ